MGDSFLTGYEFGRFRIGEVITDRDNSQQYECVDLESSYQYSISVPLNASTPRNASVGSLDATKAWEANLHKTAGSSDRQVFGLVDDRYLVAVSNPQKLKRAWGIVELTTKAKPDDLLYFGLWEGIALQMMSEAHEVSRRRLDEQTWKERWASISGGDILVNAITDYLENGNLSRTEKLRVLERVRVKSYEKPEFAENILLRFCGAVERGRITAESMAATLMSEDFRRNITEHEIQQLDSARKAMRASESPFAAMNDDVKMIDVVLQFLEQRPLSYENAPKQFEQILVAPDVSSYDTFIEAVERHGH